MKQNKKGFSILLAMSLVILMSLIAMSILDYMIPFSRSIKGIENSVGAYYQANSGLESALLHMNSPQYELGDNYDVDATGVIGSGFSIIGGGSVLPAPGKGNSNFDPDWNRISTGNPIQLQVGQSKLQNAWATAKFYFRVPDLNTSGNNNLKLTPQQTPIINWSLSSKNSMLYASGSYITSDHICGSYETLCKPSIFNNKYGVTLGGVQKQLNAFYTEKCVTDECTLKLSIIDKLSAGTTLLPYLEWKIDFGTPTIPFMYSDIEAEGISYGFRRHLKLSLPNQPSTSEAFDFTVFQ